MQQALLNLLTTCMTDLKATTSDLKVPVAAVGDTSFGALLSQAMDGSSVQGAAGDTAQVKSPSPLDLIGLLSALLGKEAAASGQTVQATAFPAALQTASDGSLKGPDGGSRAASDEWLQGATGAAAGSTLNEGTATGTNVKSGQQLQDLIMGLLALVMTKEDGTGGQAGAATGSDSGEEQAAAEQGNGITTGVKDGKSTNPSERGKASSNSNTSNSTSETENRHLLDTLALLLFTGLEAAKQVPVEASGASGEAQSLLPEDGRTATEIATAVPPAAGGPATGSTGANSWETVVTRGVEANGFAARLLDSGKDAAPSTGMTAVRAELTLNPASGVSPADQNNLSLRISTYTGSAPPPTANAATSFAPGRVPGSVLPLPGGRAASPLISADAAASVGRTDSASHDGVVTIVKELTPLLFEGRDGNGSHDPAAGKESPGAKGGYPITLDEHVSVNNQVTQEQQVSGQSGSTPAIERFDRIMEQVATGTGSHDMTVRLTVGNDESLVLGLKDLGQTVTVEVRGSSQGMINLLQSQRDVIISHLEGKDISANIVIDPNASGTPEKRDRREMRQRTSGPRGKSGGGFDGLLEIFA
jgi:hypothetical protein